VTAKNSGHHEQASQDGESSKPKWWKRPLVWIVGVATALVIAAATAFGTGVGQDLFRMTLGSHRSPVDPVQIDSASYIRTNDPTFAFRRVLTTAQVRALTHNPYFTNGGQPQGNMWEEYMKLVTNSGGASEDPMIQIVLQGHASQTVTITDMQVVKRCGPPLTGTLLYSPGAGAPPDIQLVYDLDPQFAVAQYENSAGALENFFASRTIQLKPGEVDAMVVQSLTYNAYCQFTFRITVDDGATQIEETISNNGKPFVVTAFSHPTWEGIKYKTIHFSDFKSIYAGGVASPAGDDTYVWVNPKTYNGG
jgi:hypothetical protein